MEIQSGNDFIIPYKNIFLSEVNQLIESMTKYH